jgi:2-polyprenyl-3-methyl-5-hydroxy-6-metoxy-1,4-benzoquinol methylase
MISSEHQISFIHKVHETLSGETAGKDYPDIYLSYLVTHLSYFVKIYADVLNKGLQLADVRLDEARLVDLGAGNGMMGLFATYCGCKEVYINDIDGEFIKAAQQLSQMLSIEPTGFIEGDITAVKNYFANGNSPDICIGTDMIEHVYDLDSFFNILSSLSSTKAFIFTTASNPRNFCKVRQLRKIQYNDEYKGGMPGEYLLYGGTAMKPFREIRKEIILQTSDIQEPVLSELVSRTRGLIRADIEKAVKKYESAGQLPDLPENDYNTCHPLTGSWSERILPLQTYRDIISHHRWEMNIEAGYYNSEHKSIKGRILHCVNCIIPYSCLRLAPFIFISGKRNTKKSG